MQFSNIALAIVFASLFLTGIVIRYFDGSHIIVIAYLLSLTTGNGPIVSITIESNGFCGVAAQLVVY